MTSVGSKVVCVSNDAIDLITAKGTIRVGPAPNLDEGMVYTITQIWPDPVLGISSYKLLGVPRDSGIVGAVLDIPGYAAQRFRPVVEKGATAEQKQTAPKPKVNVDD